MGAFAEGLGLFRGLAFLVVAAFFEHALGQHAEVAHDGNACGGDGADFVGLADAAFEFDGLGTGRDEAAGGRERLLGRVVSVNRQVADDEGLRPGTGNGGDVVQHVVERDVGGVGEAKHDHPERVADEQNIHAAFVEQAGAGVVVGREDGDTASAFASADGFGFLESGHSGRRPV